MQVLKERLEVRVPSSQLAALKQEAQRRRVPIAELVREAIDLLLQRDRQARLAAAEALFEVEAPVSRGKA